MSGVESADKQSAAATLLTADPPRPAGNTLRCWPGSVIVFSGGGDLL